MRDKDFPTIEWDSEENQTLMEERCVRCCMCHKVFCVSVPESYTYKLNNKYGKLRFLCSWTCYRKAQNLRNSSRIYREGWK